MNYFLKPQQLDLSSSLSRSFLSTVLGALFLLCLSACSSSSNSPASSHPSATPIPPASLVPGSISSNAWVPSITGGGATQVKGSVTLSKKTSISTGVGMVRLNDPWGSQQVAVDLGTHAQSDFGPNGSITLVADVLNYPISGGAYPVLTSFYVVETGTHVTYEYVNLSDSCASSGAYTCSGGLCDPNPSCAPSGGASGFLDRTDWEQHQVTSYGYTSTNSFPRCDSSVNGWGTCPATLSSLKDGHYYARYILLSDNGDSVAGKTANLQVTQVIKQDTQARNAGGSNGAINLNVILVGDQNIADSHTQMGAQNLNLLFGEVHSLLAVNAGVGINSIQVYEWADAEGGSQYSQVDFDNLGVMFASGSKGVLSSDETNYINVFIVSDIVYSGANFTVLGLAGGILGPPTNGTQNSGLAFSSSNQLASFNPACTAGSCTRDLQENDFLEMGATIAHELGHYLGLNHPSEKVTTTLAAQEHDQLSDTPRCKPRSSFGSYVLDQRSCYSDSTNTLNSVTCQTACDQNIQTTQGIASGKYFATGSGSYTPDHLCSAVAECQFNHLMWYTTKNRIRDAGGAWIEDGNLVSAQSASIVQWDSFVR